MNNYNIYYWLKNSEYFFKHIINIVNEKSIVCNKAVHTEMLYVRRLFVDWIKANVNMSDMHNYVSFKMLLLDYSKSNNDNKLSKTIYYVIWKDFNLFLESHSDYLLDIYKDCMKKNYKKFIYKHKLIFFSIISVFLFFKWKKKRNDSIRHWFNYNNRRKKNINIDIALFNKLILNEAKIYGERYRQKIEGYII